MTNRLRLYTEHTDLPCVYRVRWMTGLDTKGIVLVTVSDDIDDGKVAAELAVARWLLEVHNVCGHDKTGAGLVLYFSAGAVKKLARGESAKNWLARYAHFLRTRFYGAEIAVENRDHDWTSFEAEPLSLDATTREIDLLDMRGAGRVELTAHAIEQYAERFERKAVRAWRELRALMVDPKLYEVKFRRRRGTSDIHHRTAGRYFYLPSRDIIFVVTNSVGMEPAKVVTIYPADQQLKLRLYEARNSGIDLEELGNHSANDLNALRRTGLVQVS